MAKDTRNGMAVDFKWENISFLEKNNFISSVQSSSSVGVFLRVNECRHAIKI